MLVVLLHGHHLGYPSGVRLQIRAASDQGPGSRPLLLTGSSLHGGPQCDVNSQQRTYRNLCCTVYDAYVPLRHFADYQVGAANGAGPSECTAGVTPAPSENLGQRTEARTGPGPLYPCNGKRPPTIQRTCDDTASWPPQRPADGQQRAALRRGGDGTRSRGLINPSRRMFSTAPVRGLSSWCLRVSLNFTSAHQCPACAFGQKTTLRAPRWRSSRGTAPNRKSRPAAQRLAATEVWRPGRRRAT